MQYGVCGGPEIAEAAARAGFDYFEWSVGALLQPPGDKEMFLHALKKVRPTGLPCPVLNCFLPSELKIVGANVDSHALKKYVSVAFERAQHAMVEVIVLGSSGARTIPAGFDRAKAQRQLVAFSRMCCDIAQEHDITLVAEPISRSETNVLNTVNEAADFVREIDDPRFRLMVDSYHWMKDRDSSEAIIANGSLLAHAHVATAAGRKAPGAENCDFAPFFAALRKAGYNGRVSIEGTVPNPAEDLPCALELMKALAG